ncbi:MAG: MBL fold metallo-hydrolase [Candidatus Eisenbacteria bacterium]|nr:MBL fold metallo-hydrolase [Candidatus Eisenbacteria bacterium]
MGRFLLDGAEIDHRRIENHHRSGDLYAAALGDGKQHRADDEDRDQQSHPRLRPLRGPVATASGCSVSGPLRFWVKNAGQYRKIPIARSTEPAPRSRADGSWTGSPYGGRMLSWIDLGGISAASLIASRFRLDGGSMFGQVPKLLWSRYAKADAQNRIPLVVRLLLVQSGERRILVDAGMGGRYGPRERAQMAIDPDLADLGALLVGADVPPDSISDVVLTHLHFDHVAGLGRASGRGPSELVVPQARLHLQRAQWERAHDPGPKERRSFRAADLELLARGRLELHDGPAEIAPGVRLRRSDGHTEGQQWVSLHGARGVVFYPADLIPTAAHIRAAYTMGFDLRPDLVIRERGALLAEATRESAVLVFAHDPRTAAARVREGRDEYVIAGKEPGWA